MLVGSQFDAGFDVLGREEGSINGKLTLVWMPPRPSAPSFTEFLFRFFQSIYHIVINTHENDRPSSFDLPMAFQLQRRRLDDTFAESRIRRACCSVFAIVALSL